MQLFIVALLKNLSLISINHTTAQETKDEISLNDKKLLYSNDDLDIFGMYDDDKYLNGLKLYIRNKSGKDYTLDDYELRADGVNIKSGKYQLFKQYLIPSLYINLIVYPCRISPPVHGGCCYAY